MSIPPAAADTARQGPLAPAGGFDYSFGSMKTKAILGILLAGVLTCAVAAELPYNEKANAAADVQRALTAAQADHKHVLLVFGANWCPDCRDLDKAMHGSSRAMIEGQFEVAKIDVGNFDKNLDIDRRYGNPIKLGIPAVVVLSADNHVLYSTKGGELANARTMGESGIYEFFVRHIASAHE